MEGLIINARRMLEQRAFWRGFWTGWALVAIPGIPIVVIFLIDRL